MEWEKNNYSNNNEIVGNFNFSGYVSGSLCDDNDYGGLFLLEG